MAKGFIYLDVINLYVMKGDKKDKVKKALIKLTVKIRRKSQSNRDISIR